ncbi:MAG: PfkB family carbohydrate kinase [Alphaproteobacteria bacterium]
MNDVPSAKPCVAEVACFGGLNIDRQGAALAPVVPGSSNPVRMTTDVGGVAANVARALAALGRRVTLVARVGATGSRSFGRALAGLVDPLLIVDRDRPTASYTSLIEPDGRLFVGLADMEVHDAWDHGDVDRAIAHAAAASVWFVDANLPSAALARLATMAGSERILAANGVSAAKAGRLAGDLHRISMLFANAEEAAVLGIDPEAPRRGQELTTVVTHGGAGLAVAVGNDVWRIPAPALPGPAVDETGAGDCLVAGVLAGRLAGLDRDAAFALGQRAAAAALVAPVSVPEEALRALAPG